MKFIQPFLLLPFLFTLSLWSATPVPYSGKIDIRGVNYFGEALFAFSLHDGNGTTHWRNGKQPGETIKATIRNGRYTVLLGGQGMNSLPPELFLKHDKLYLKVEVDMGDEEGLRHLAPDQLITATPRALVADLAKVSEVAKVAEKVGNGAITRDMLSSEVLAQLDANVTASPSAPVTITRDMLPQDVRDDLNKTVTITRNMLPADVLSDLNRTISKSMLGSDVLADLNKSSTTASPITLSMLAPEVTAKLDQNVSGRNGVVAGSLISVPYGQSAPAGYSLYQQGTPKELVWEEKAPVSVARKAYDGVEVLNGNIYFVGGHGKDQLDDNLSTDIDINERYNPNENSWQKLQEISNARNNISSVVFDNKLWILGGYNSVSNFNTVEFYDPVLDNWSQSTQLPVGIRGSNAIFVNGHIYLIGGFTDQTSNKVFSFEPITNTWAEKANLPTPRYGLDLVWFQNRIWAIGGQEFQGETKDVVESYDPISDSWKTETSLKTKRSFPVSWVADGKIFVGGGAHLDSDSNNSSNFIYSDSLELYDPATNQWSYFGKLPEKKYLAGSVVLNNKVYVIGGSTADGVFSNKVFAADLNASMEGVYDLYRKDGNASAGTPLVQAEMADGSVTTAKLDSTILKYLKPEIKSQPQAQPIYAETNATFTVTAEGKYLTYQWKKGGSSLAGETNATLTIADANATLHDGNYSVVVSNDFGSIESDLTEVLVKDGILNGLVGWWRFDEGSGTVAYDSSGNGHHGNLLNGSTWTNGKIGGAISLDGANDYVEISSRKWNIDNLFSVSFWYLNYGTNGTIFSLGTPPYNNEILLWILEGRQDFYYHKGSGNWARIHEPTLSQGWHHKTIIVNGGYQANQLSSFINGNLYQSTYTNGGISGLLSDLQDRVLRIGYRVNDSQFYNGLIDDLRIYDRALSAADVQALYNLGQ